MSQRHCYGIPGADHGGAGPMPMAARVGNAFQSRATMGKDAATKTLPDHGVKQVEFAFTNTKVLLDVAGVALDHVVCVDVLLTDDVCSEVNRHSAAWFRQERDRPPRHTTVREQPGGMLVQLRVEADIEDPHT